jgi:hypothetical protein
LCPGRGGGRRGYGRQDAEVSWAFTSHCARSTVYEAIHALEKPGILTWVNRLVRDEEDSIESRKVRI